MIFKYNVWILRAFSKMMSIISLQPSLLFSTEVLDSQHLRLIQELLGLTLFHLESSWPRFHLFEL